MANRRKRKSLKSTLFLVVLLIIVAGLYYGYEYYQKNIKDDGIIIPDGTVQVHYIDVGQGDSALIVAPNGETLLIDAGEDGDAAEYLEEKKISVIDYMVVTHYDSDHIGGADEVLELAEVKTVIRPDYDHGTKMYQNLLALIDEEGSEEVFPTLGMTVALGDLSMKILSSEKTYSDSNDNSIVLMLTFGKNKFLFSGDAEKKRESEVLDAWSKEELDADVFKAGHHGASNANNEDFLAAVTPSIVVVSCGKGNDYGHPTNAALERFKVHTDKILRTDLVGTIILSSDGEKITSNKSSAISNVIVTQNEAFGYTAICIDLRKLYSLA